MLQTTKTYKGYTIQCLFSGWYSTKSNNVGYLKADTLAGIKRLIDNETKLS
jgi:hypothetical protein